MDVPKITMDPDVALEKINAWFGERHADQAEVKAQCLAGYKALAEGHQLIQLDAAIRGGGFHASGFPKLAIARADRERVRFTWMPGTTLVRYDARADPSRGGRGSPGTLVRRVDLKRAHEVTRRLPDGSYFYRMLDGWSQVPLLPAEHRPERGLLKDWFILWEVEQWYASDLTTEPDRDPLLLQHVAGQLYAVLAEWELTDLERAVMAGALRPEPTND